MTAPVVERLSTAHLGWLKEFSVAMHRRYAYPPRHSSRLAADEVALRALTRALDQFPEIIIAITKRQLAIGGAYSDPKNPALGELAERLHRQGIGSVTIRAGVDAEEFDALLDRIVQATPRGPDDDRDEEQPGVHVAVDMLSYEGLALNDDESDVGGPDATGDRLWRELAEMALAGWDGFDDFGTAGGGNAEGGAVDGGSAVSGAAEGGANDAQPVRPSVAMRRADELPAAQSVEAVAKMIGAAARDPRHASGVLQSLLKVGRHARRRGRKGSGAVAAQLRELLQKLEPGTLKSLLDAEQDPARKQSLLLQGVDALPVSAVIDWIEGAAASVGKGITPHLLRLLTKLSKQTHRRGDNGPDEGGEALRQAARRLIEDWTLEINETEAHESLLSRIAAYDTPDRAGSGGEVAGADRIVKIALETNSCGADVLEAVDQLIAAKKLDELFTLLDTAERATVAAPAIDEHVLEAEIVRRVLLDEPIEPRGVRALLARCTAAHGDAVLDALAISEIETTRRVLCDRLRELGDSVRDQMIGRLEGSPWYVQRNLLSLLGELPNLPTNVAYDSFLMHAEPMLRLEALKLVVRIPDRREAAIHDALADTDGRVLRAAIEAAGSRLPRRSALRVLQLLEKSSEKSDIRLHGIFLLSQVPLQGARDWLLPLVARTRGIFMFRRLALTPKSSEMLAALRVLAIRWANDPAVAPVLKLALKSSDEEINGAGAARAEE